MQAQSLKIDPILLEEIELSPDKWYSVYVILEDQVDIAALHQEMKKAKMPIDARAVNVVQTLQDKAAKTQPKLLEKFSKLSNVRAITPYWITNAIAVEANADAIMKISEWEAVQLIEAMPRMQLFNEQPPLPAPLTPENAEPGLRTINAHKLWELGYTGYGQTILVIDSGQNGNHPALKSNFRGNDVDIAQAWTGTRFPEDCGIFHGSHVMGIAVGIDRETNDTIGVAPNAEWLGSPFKYEACDLGQYGLSEVDPLAHFQWALNPDGDATTTEDIPDVINNSWGSEQISCNFIYRNTLLAMEAAGIATVWAIGNMGPTSNTTASPASLNMSIINAFAVGSVESESEVVSNFSSRGPTSCSGIGSLSIKPEVVAPGESGGFVRSAGEGIAYSFQGGTSQAAPHVSGALLLLKEAFPYLSGEDLKLALYYSARDLGEVGEDNSYGNGLIDVMAAYNYLINEGNAPVPPTPANNDVVLLNVKTERSVLCRGEVAIDILFENVTNINLNELTIDYFLTTNTVDRKTFQWTGDLCVDCTTDIQLPPLEDLQAGAYELVVELNNPNGQPDERTRNNLIRHAFQVVDLDYIEAQVNDKYASTVCRDAKVVLESNTVLAENEHVEWYDLPVGGLKIGEGNPFLTDELVNSEIFYADIATTFSVGKTALSDGEEATLNMTSGGLKFDALKPFKLVSVKVYAEEAGGRFIKLVDADGNTLEQRIVRLDPGEQRIELQFDVPAGQGFELALMSGKPLYYDSIGASYPYEVADVMKITRASTAPFSLRYMFFYDWEIATNHGCGRTAVPIQVNSSQSANPIFMFASADTLTLQDGATIEFSHDNDNVRQLTWTFGDGVTSNEANPLHTYQNAGTYPVILTIEDENGCINSASLEVIVLDKMTTSTNEVAKAANLIIYPNPTSNVITIQTNEAIQMQVQIVDLLGKVVAEIEANGSQLSLDLAAYPNGIYYVLVNVNEQQLVEKIIKTD